ncbi:phenylalanine-4-hydroxylase [Marinicauda pacifica]|jgi:phenylalanine-4-hydroxylase|uniref:Phenylalanine-4-hydroxylase n=1 Tax=Marinicauda pacifica TaxID=1133559 RepID=A0A4S2HEN3_9PROT|nr:MULTISPECIES: phenylalanine 4-monooxygenase [Marinicauda]TGY94258.1 phenylalanine 4-monooxygenase [Marinicauda pacifica]GGE34317.1 phenylalanine-4-hydroxylase [Marinicauda pacifica]
MPVNDPVVAEQTPAADHTIDQCWDRYSEEEHGVWNTLYDRQMKVLKGRAAPEHFKGLELLNLNDGGIPDFRKVNEKLYALTGWQVVTVHGLIPNDVFFNHLANRRFVSGRFIRDADKLDYLPEPDIFHDVFGHVPLLTLPAFADYMQAYGQGGEKAMKVDMIENLTRLYWYTVEFGLINTPEGRRIYGAGIVSSQSESRFCLEGRSPNRIHFDLERIMRTDYRYDDFQQTYFVIDSYEELMESTANVDFGPIYERLKGLPDYKASEVLPSDKVYHEGTQEYAKAGGLEKKAEWV